MKSSFATDSYDTEGIRLAWFTKGGEIDAIQAHKEEFNLPQFELLNITYDVFQQNLTTGQKFVPIINW